MQLFQLISKIADGYDISIDVITGKDKVTVMVYPKVKNPKLTENPFPPYILSGEPEEIDNEFEEKFAKALRATTSVVDNLEFFESQLEKAAKEKEKKTSKKSSSKTKKEDPDQKTLEEAKEGEVEKEEDAPEANEDDKSESNTANLNVKANKPKVEKNDNDMEGDW